MSIFDIFRKKQARTKNNKSSNDLNYLQNPSNFFACLGPALNELWQNLVKGEHQAVEIYHNYKKFCDFLSEKYPNINFDRILENIDTEGESIRITAGEVMFLYLMNINKDIYISKNNDLPDGVLLSKNEYIRLVHLLSEKENLYIKELKSYIDQNIKRLCSEVALKRWGDDEWAETSLPIHTRKIMEYHKFIAAADTKGIYNYGDKWNKIYNAPIVANFYLNKKNNPLVLLSVECIDTLILDSICFATISLPSLDIDRVLTYTNNVTGESVLKTIDEVFGNGAHIFADRAITNFSSSEFRYWVKFGMKVE